MASPVRPSYIPRAVVVWGSAFGVLASHAPPSGLSRRDSAKYYLLYLVGVLLCTGHHQIPNQSDPSGVQGAREYHEAADKTVRTVNTVQMR